MLCGCGAHWCLCTHKLCCILERRSRNLVSFATRATVAALTVQLNAFVFFDQLHMNTIDRFLQTWLARPPPLAAVLGGGSATRRSMAAT